MDGILCINKPKEYTSFDVVARIRGMSKTRRVGHSGTLDPMATGVLSVFIGNATKACDRMPTDTKSYTADFLLGKTSDTLDVWGPILSEQVSRVTEEELRSCLPEFRGEIVQIPPMYSAVRVNGQRLYDLARQGKEVERQPRTVFVHHLELLSFDAASQSGRLEISCSKGTYIRSILSDLGSRLGVGGMMTGLVRTAAGPFSLADCITLEEAQALTEAGRLEERLLPVDRLFESLPEIRLNEVQSRKFRNGVRLDLNRVRCQPGEGLHRVYAQDRMFLGLARSCPEEALLRIEKLFV